MSILQATASPAPANSDDRDAIDRMKDAFTAQRNAFAKDRNPDIEVRRERIQKLMGMMVTNRERISAAMSRDFGAHPAPASDLIEVLGVLGRAQYVLDHVEEWMQPAPRETDPAMLGSARAYVQYQPKGVVGNISPWNFPFDLSVGPMIEMLAAGNRVMLKPSEYAPACSNLLREMVEATFDPDLVYVAVGGIALSQAFSGLPFDHLLYTGSPDVGRLIMAAAAKNLTPVTLELGGKCPAILTPGSVTADSVESVIGTKVIKNGQMCISVDYCFVPRDEIDSFVDHAWSYMNRAAPDYSRGPDCTGIISQRHLDRITAMLEEAKDRQCKVIPLETSGATDPESRRIPISLVIDPPKDMRVMQEEIFGPILPVIPYDDLDAVIDAVNAGERPLGLYVFGDDEQRNNHVLNHTMSGGAAVNTCAVQGALPSLGFGGVGMSGMGRHHGHAGFLEFSNPRGVVVRGSGDMLDAFYAPYSKAAAIVEAALSSNG